MDKGGRARALVGAVYGYRRAAYPQDAILEVLKSLSAVDAALMLGTVQVG